MSVVGWKPTVPNSRGVGFQSAESQVFAISDPQDLNKAGKETFVSLL